MRTPQNQHDRIDDDREERSGEWPDERSGEWPLIRIGISGYATSGKDEVAKVLVEEYGFTRVNMSDALNEYLAIIDPYIPIPTHLEGRFAGPYVHYTSVLTEIGYTEAKKIPEVRRLLQVFGTEVGRAIDPHMWTAAAALRSQRHERVVTTGIRFSNEITNDMIVVHVTRPNTGPANDHASEDLFDVESFADWYIHNDGTLDDLREAVRKVMVFIEEAS